MASKSITIGRGCSVRAIRGLFQIRGVHGFRHSFAVELLQRGASLVTIKDELGHKEIETTMKYLTVAPRDRSEAMLRLFAD